MLNSNQEALIQSRSELDKMKRRIRLLMLLDAAERAGITPISTGRLHAFAYLADVLSPVWDLAPFDGFILKSNDGPHYSDIQGEIETLIVHGLIEASDLHFVARPNDGARIEGNYSLRFESNHLKEILQALGVGAQSKALDQSDVKVHRFLVDLADALATLPEDQLSAAASADVTYADERVAPSNVISFSNLDSAEAEPNPSVRTAERFDVFMPPDSTLSPAQKLYLYASYLKRRANVG